MYCSVILLSVLPLTDVKQGLRGVEWVAIFQVYASISPNR